MITRHAPARRRGATSVEVAITAPVLFLLFFTAYEFSRMEMVRHTVDIAAYEGARRGIIPGATLADVEREVQEVLSAVSVRNAVITVTPAVIERNTREVTVEVDVPTAGNGWLPIRFFQGIRLVGTSTLAREGFTSPDA